MDTDAVAIPASSVRDTLKRLLFLCGAGLWILGSPGAHAAPTEYTITYLAGPTLEFGVSGFGRFVYDPTTQIVSDLTWDFGNGRSGALAAPESDSFLGSLLLGTAVPGGGAAKHPPEISGFFDFAQWMFRGEPWNDFSYAFGRGFDTTVSMNGAFVARERYPNTFPIFFDRFEDAERSGAWQTVSGQWVRTANTFNSATALPVAITTITSYEVSHSSVPAAVLDENQPYAVTARLMNRRSTPESSVGLVYNYQDAAHFNEIAFSPDGKVQLRETRGGLTTLLATDAYEGGVGRWIDVELRRGDGHTSAYVDGKPLFTEVAQSALAAGRVGLVTRATTGAFDDVRIHRPLYRWPFRQAFDGGAAPEFLPVRGDWRVASGEYVSDVQQTTLALVSAQAQPGRLGQFGLRARLLNPYGASGNSVGLVWNSGQNEVVFTSTGEARLSRISGGSSRLIRAVPIPRLGNQRFEVELDVCFRCGVEGWSATIKLNGATIFEKLQGEDFFPDGGPTGAPGLVTHWSPGRFDDVEFRLAPFPERYLQYFDARASEVMPHQGAWALESGTYVSQAVGPADIALIPAGDDGDFVYRARVVNEYGASGNLVGLVTHYTDDGDYYEAVLSGTGEVQVNKVIKGVRIRQATGAYSARPGRVFNLELRSVGTLTDVKVDGKTVISKVPQGQLRGGRIGVITHWSRGRFDELSWEELRLTTAACDLCDTFNSGAASRWQPVGGNWTVENLKYVGRGKADVCGTGISSNESLIRELQASDVDVQADIRSFAGSARAFVLRSTGPGNQIELYIVGEQSAVLVQELRNCQPTIQQWLYFPVRFRSKVTAHFRAQLLGDYLRVWMNDHLYIEFELPFTSTRGAVGVGVSDGESAAFDNVRIDVLR